MLGVVGSIGLYLVLGLPIRCKQSVSARSCCDGCEGLVALERPTSPTWSNDGMAGCLSESARSRWAAANSNPNLVIRRSIRSDHGGPPWSLSGVGSCVMILADELILDWVAVSVALN
jgi:hypothetical protein